MPNNEPITMDSTSLRDRIKRSEPQIYVNVGFYSALPNSYDEIDRIAEEGAIGFKLYLNRQVGGVDIEDDETILEAFNRINELHLPIAVHAEDRTTIEAVKQTEEKLGHNDVTAYLRAHKPQAELKAVRRVLRLAKKSGVYVHFSHISSYNTVVLIRRAREDGMSVSCEVTPHHLLLSIEDLKRCGTALLTDPPVRRKTIVERLWYALKNQQIDVIASDHAPYPEDEKEAESIWDVKPGIPGLETLVPLLLTKVAEGRLSLKDVVRLTAEKPAEVFHLKGYGSIKEGFNANITVIDIHRNSKIDAAKFLSKAKHSPFDKWDVKGMPVMTVVNGQLVMDEGELIGPVGSGRVIKQTRD
jgi:dihydroorotase